jgi:signal transduction histidine kinase/ActR/RegA family two-component response regulator
MKRLPMTGKREAIEERVILPNGQVKIHRMEGQAVPGPDGRLTRVVGTLQDVTEQRKMERQLLHATKMEAIGGVTGGMAHDFNNLLGVIVLNLGFLESRMDPSDRLRTLVTEALSAAERGADLVKSLLAFARRQPLRPTRIAINDVVTSMSRLLRRVLGEDIHIDLVLSAETWPVTVDAAQLEACIMNLATNARDAMPKGGALTLRTGNQTIDEATAQTSSPVTPGDYAVISVTDDGTGMPPEVMARIFEPFFSTKQTGKGTGLGLSMVFGFAAQSGGHVTAQSKPGEGTTIQLFLPRAEVAEEQRALTAREAMPISGGRGEAILVVEDNRAMRTSVVNQLSELGYVVRQARDTASALAILATTPIDLVFCDVVMPGEKDGIDLAAEVKARFRNTHVVLTSGFMGGTAADRLTGSLASVHLLSKPYEPRHLAAIIRETLDCGAKAVA